MSLSFVLHAKNSSGRQMLFVDRDAGDEINLTLCGEHEGKDIQIDFDSISGEDLADLVRFLSYRLKRELEHLTSKSIISAVRVPKGYVIENQGPAIRVAAPDGGTDLLWPGDAMYPLVKPLAVTQEPQP